MVDVGDFRILRCLGFWEFCFCFWILIDFGIEGCMGFLYLFVVFLFSFLNCGIVCFCILDFGIVGFWVCWCLVEFSGCLDLDEFWILGFLDLGLLGFWGF